MKTAARLVLSILVCAAALLACTTRPQAAELTVLSGTVTRSSITKISALFEQQTGHKVSLHFATHPILKKQIEGGERFDVVTIEADMIDELVEKGRIVRDTQAHVARIGMALLAATAAQKPDIATVESFKSVLRSASSIGYVGDGHSGVVFLRTLERMGLTGELKPKLKPLTGIGCNVAIPKGLVELCATPAAGLAPGVQMLGRFPAEIQTYVVIAAGASTASGKADAARSFIKFLGSAEAAAVFRALNFEPMPVR